MAKHSFFFIGMCMAIFGCPGILAAAETVLPQGSAPAALVAPHFPSRAHEFVFRNWNAVEPAKLAKLLGASVEDITALAESMGLPREPVVSKEMMQRGYVTLIRRNWHLLPYEQLLELLEMTPERLAVMLREEDFLFIKLGSLKPACEPLRYQPPDKAAQKRAAEIRHVLEQDFGGAMQSPAEPRFDFVRQLSAPLPNYIPPKSETDAPHCIRIVYSYVAVYGDPLMNPQLNPYPDGLLQRLSTVGINGVWIHALLRDLAPGGDTFPEFGAGTDQRLANLRTLVDRAKQFGIDVYLYINEPRAMPAAFFDKGTDKGLPPLVQSRPDMAGVKEGDFTALCTSHPAVRKWMGDALAHIFREVPGLGGVYTITASENLTNCASHGAWSTCEHCKGRTDTDILAEVAAVIEEGVHRSAPKAAVLMSDWGWKGHGEAPDIIAKLPKSACLMSVSEWSLPIERGGIKSTVGEYSISAVGPGPRAQKEWNSAQDAGLKTGTEIQFNNTCEIASIPYLPVMDLIAEHCHNLAASAKIDAMLIGWTMGGYPSPNFQLAQKIGTVSYFSSDKKGYCPYFLDALAQERFGPEGAPYARKAWTLMSDAYREYPFHISVVYTSPVQVGPANPLYPAKTGYSATMWGIPYDNLDGWRGPYPPDIFAAQFEKVAQGWQPGIAELELAVAKTPEGKRAEAQSDVRMAKAACIHFQSVANQARFVHARDTLVDSSKTLPPEEQTRLKDVIKKSLESEITLAQQLYALTLEDSRIGFEPSCQYFYLPLDLVEKVINCRWLLRYFEEFGM